MPDRVARVLAAPGQVPVLGVVQIRETAVHQGPQVVQRGRGAVIGLQQAPGIGFALGRIEPVDEVPAVDGHPAAVHQLRVAAAGLGVLARDAAQVDHARAAAVGDEHGHLEQHA